MKDDFGPLFGDLTQQSLTNEEKDAGRRSLMEYMRTVRPESVERPKEHMQHSYTSTVPGIMGMHLTKEEFDSGREHLRMFTAQHPLPESAPAFAGVASFLFFLRSPVLAAVALVFVCAGGVSYAAEGSMPGDFLYPVKIGFNERVRSAVAIGDEGKRQWAVERFGRRAEEAATLKQEAAASQRWVMLEKVVENDQAETSSLSQSLRANGREEAAAAFETAVNARVNAAIGKPKRKELEEKSPKGKTLLKLHSFEKEVDVDIDTGTDVQVDINGLGRSSSPNKNLFEELIAPVESVLPVETPKSSTSSSAPVESSVRSQTPSSVQSIRPSSSSIIASSLPHTSSITVVSSAMTSAQTSSLSLPPLPLPEPPVSQLSLPSLPVSSVSVDVDIDIDLGL